MIKCLKCWNIVEMLDYHHVEIDELQPRVRIVDFKEEDILCEDCKEYLAPKEYYFDEQEDLEKFKADALDYIAEILSSKIEHCSHCGGYDLESFVNVMNNELEEDDTAMRNMGIDTQDFIFDEGVPEEYYNEIVSKLICGGCGYGGDVYDPKNNPDGGSFEIMDRFYTDEDIDKFYGVNYDALSHLAEEYGIQLDEAEFSEFKDYIYENPMLALRHHTGNKIYELLSKAYNAGKYQSLQQGLKLYRGRTRKKDKNRFGSKDLWNPPEGQASHGRYNSVGVSVLYCAENVGGIPYEVHPIHDEVIDVGTFVVKKELKILDVSNLFGDFAGFSEINTESTAIKKAYLLTNFIRDCCYSIGYKGVQYVGVELGGYNNFALFNFTPREDIEVEDVITVDYEIVYKTRKITTTLSD